jgi:hypothetical protein
MLDRVNTLPLSVQEKSKELGIIKVIAKNNGYSKKLVLNAYNKHNKRKKENHSTLQRFDGVGYRIRRYGLNSLILIMI